MNLEARRKRQRLDDRRGIRGCNCVGRRAFWRYYLAEGDKPEEACRHFRCLYEVRKAARIAAKNRRDAVTSSERAELRRQAEVTWHPMPRSQLTAVLDDVEALRSALKAAIAGRRNCGNELCNHTSCITLDRAREVLHATE